MDLYNLQKRFEILARVDPKVYSRLANRIRRVGDPRRVLATMRIADAGKEKYLEQLNLKALQKQTPGQGPEYYQRLQEEAKKGPLFSEQTLATILKLPNKINKVETKWLATQLEANSELNLQKLQSVLDYARADRVQLDNQPYEEVEEASEEWHEQFIPQKEDGTYSTGTGDTGDTGEVVYRFSDGYTVSILISADALQREGDLMGHCVGSYCDSVEEEDSFIYSIRDRRNMPHVTIEFNRDNKVVQIQGKQDKPPIKKYHKYIIEFLVANNTNWNNEALSYATPEVFDKLAHHSSYLVRSDIAKYHQTPLNVLETLSQDENERVRYDVTENKRVTTSILEKLSHDKSDLVRSGVASIPKTPVPVLVRLAKDPNKSIRATVVRNPSTPEDIINGLIRDSSRIVRSSVSSRLKDPNLIHDMAKDKDHKIRQNVALNSNTSPKTLLLLAKDHYDLVRFSVALNSNTPPEALVLLAKDAYEDVVVRVAHHSNTPSDVLKTLAKKEGVFVRRAVAGNKNSPPASLRELAKDKDVGVRLNVAANRSTPPDAVKRLTEDENDRVSRSARENTGTESDMPAPIPFDKKYEPYDDPFDPKLWEAADEGDEEDESQWL